MQRRCASSPRQDAQRRSLFGLMVLGMIWVVGGCQHYYRPRPVLPLLAGLTPPMPMESVQAMVAPPIGWKPEPLKSSDRHTHQVWLSPTGDTAYGAIRFRLPLPVGNRLLMNRFLAEMRRIEGGAELLSREDDPELPGIRFMAQSPIHTVRVNLITHGFRGWAFYAGTITGKPDNLPELELAERAREASSPGLPPGHQPAATGDQAAGTPTTRPASVR